MNKKWMAIGWSALALTGFAVLMIFKGALALKDREKTVAYVNLERESAALTRLVGAQVNGLARDLQRDVSVLLATPEGPKPTDFLAVALLHLNSQSQWDAKWLTIGEEIATKATETQLQLAIKDLPVTGVEKNAGVFARLQDPLLATTFAFLVPVQRADTPDRFIAVGLVPAPLLSQWSDIFRGSDREMLVVDDKGYALALSQPAYVGTSLEKQPFVAEVLKSAALTGRVSTQDFAQHPAFGVFEHVAKTNLTVLVDRPTPNLKALLLDLFFQTFVVWLALLILTAAGLWMWIPEGAKTVVAESDIDMDDETPVPIAAPKVAVTMDRTMAYKIVGPGLIQAMKGPLAVILGHAQLAHAKTSDPGLREHHEMLEKEARRLRETLEALGQLSGVEYAHEAKKVDVVDLLEQVLEQMNAKFQSEKIQVAKDFSVRGSVMAAAEPLKNMFTEILNNALEGMQGQANKELKIITEQRENRFAVCIHDSGPGIDADELTKIFEPFFTTKAREEHAGLGLTMARGLMRGFGGELTVNSKKSAGTTVQVDWPLDIVIAQPVAKPIMQKPVVQTPIGPSPMVDHPLPMSAGPTVPTELTPPVLAPPPLAEEEPLLGGRPPLAGPLAEKLPEPPRPSYLSQEDEEEWQQMPKQIHMEPEKDSVQIRKPKVRIRLGN